MDNQQLCLKIPEERQICLDVKVQIRMIQQWQHDPSTMDPLIEKELWMVFTRSTVDLTVSIHL